MGAGASVKEVYSEAVGWFRQYFDSDMYVEDFRAIDKDHDGGITYGELRKWVQNKALHGDKAWKMVMSNQQVMAIAHRQASKYTTIGMSMHDQKIVDCADFKAFLLQLFAISIMWTHFKNADQWKEGMDVGNETLNLEEFSLACKSFCMSQANEPLSDAQILSDFKFLDTNQNGSISFVEVCNYCCQYVDPRRSEVLFTQNHSDPMRPITQLSLQEELNRVLENEKFNAMVVDRLATSGHLSEEYNHIHMKDTSLDKNTLAIDALADEMMKNNAIAEFVEIKHNTEMLLGVRIEHQPTNVNLATALDTGTEDHPVAGQEKEQTTADGRTGQKEGGETAGGLLTSQSALL